jgi:hypothetical protein
MSSIKTLFKAKAILKRGHLETNQRSNGLQNVTWGSLRGGRPSLTGYGWPAQSEQSPMRGQNEYALMNSQLG